MNTAPGIAADVERFGRFIVLKQLGQGGMGALSLGYDPESLRIVVLKRIRRARRDETELEARFRDEIAITSKLHHPNLIEVIDSGMVGDDRYLALEWIAGKDLDWLSERMRRYSITAPLPVLVFVVRELCRALDYAHGIAGLGFIHRDISPANIVISYDGRPCLIDYGMALSSLKTVKTEVGIRAGTRGFLSPEQRNGESLDVRTDLFSLAAVFWLLVAGRPLYNPFQLDDEPGTCRLSSLVDVPLMIDEWAAQAVSSDRNRRFQTAAAMAAPLDAYLALNPTTVDDVAKFIATLAPVDKETHEREAPLLLQHGEALARLSRQATLQLKPAEAHKVHEPTPSPPAAPSPPTTAPRTAVLPRMDTRRPPEDGTILTDPDPLRRRPRRRLAIIAASLAATSVVLIALIILSKTKTTSPPTRPTALDTPVAVVKVTPVPVSPTEPPAEPAPPPHSATPNRPPIQRAPRRPGAQAPVIDNTPPPSIAPTPAITTAPIHETTTTRPETGTTPELRQKLAMANQLAIEGQTERARSAFVELENDSRARHEALLGHAQLAVSHGMFDEAIETASRALKSGADKHAALLLRARAELRAGRTADARRDYQAILETDPTNAEAQRALR